MVVVYAVYSNCGLTQCKSYRYYSTTLRSPYKEDKEGEEDIKRTLNADSTSPKAVEREANFPAEECFHEVKC